EPQRSRRSAEKRKSSPQRARRTQKKKGKEREGGVKPPLHEPATQEGRASPAPTKLRADEFVLGLPTGCRRCRSPPISRGASRGGIASRLRGLLRLWIRSGG